MMIHGLEDAIYFRANVLAEKYGIPIERARLLKSEGITDVSADKARRLIGDDLAEPLDPVIEINNEDNGGDKDKEDL